MKIVVTIPSTTPGAVLSLKKDRAIIDLTQAELDFLVNLADVLEITDTETAATLDVPLTPVTETAAN